MLVIDQWLTVLHGDCREVLQSLPDESVDCCVTSPPYWGLRDYGVAGQLGLEKTPEEYVAAMVGVFRAVRRVLRDEGTLWLNLGDSYANDGKWGGETGGKQAYLPDNDRRRVGREQRTTGLKPKDLVGIPWRVAFALQADGWYLRSDIIWAKPNPMPESVTDRPTKSHEYLFLLTKSPRYWYDADAVREASTERPSGNTTRFIATDGERSLLNTHLGSSVPYTPNGTGRNLRTVWTIATQPYPGAHFATFPPKLVEPCILAGCPEGGTVLDPFAGTGTVGMVAQKLSRKAVLIDLNAEYLEQLATRNKDIPLGLTA